MQFQGGQVTSVSVLAVEDERIVARDLKNRLLDLGYHVLALAASAEEALALAQEQLPNVVLMDVRLAGAQDGIDAAQVFREQFDIPVVFATAHSDDATLERASMTEPYGYLVKPFGDRELKAALDIAVYRHRSERQLRESNERLRLSQKVAQLGIWVKDLRSKIIEVSEEAGRILGREGELGTTQESLFVMVDPADRPQVEDAIQKCQEGIEPMQIEFELDLGNGSARYVRQYGEVVEDKKGQKVRLLAAVQDITQYKLLEAKLRRSQKLEAIGQLAGGIAHDFNNLLIVIKGYSEMSLKAFEPGHPVYSRILEIRKAGDRAAALIQQLLSFSGRQVMRPRVIDLNQVVSDFENMLRRLLVDSVEIRKRLADGVWPVIADPDQIDQVIMNLVVNARDAMPGGGIILIETTNSEMGESQIREFTDLRPGRYVCLSVCDTGIGIPAAIRPRLFEPFFTTKEPTKGTGLGLSTVYGIVKQHRGEIAIDSEVGKGSRFRVYLPAVAEPVDMAVALGALQSARSGAETILVVTDELSVRDLAADILGQRGYNILLASSAQEALRIAEGTKARIDLMLTDLMLTDLMLTDADMPGINGLELARRMVTIRPDIRIVIMTGYRGDSVDSERTSEENFLLLTKPFGPLELERKIQDALDKN